MEPPTSTTRPLALRIQVPDSPTNPASHGLQEPFELDTTPSPGFHYRQIGQLPTPVVNNGRFPALDVPKRAARPGSRVVSEFPRNKEPALPPQHVRHISNPIVFEEPDLPRPAMPLPPQEAEPREADHVFRAPHSNRTYQFVLLVGRGAFSTVVAARDTALPHDLVAIKTIAIPTNDTRCVSSFRRYICRELGILRALHHPGMVQLLDYSLTLLITEDEMDATFASGSDSNPPGCEMYDFYTARVANEQRFFLHYLAGGNLFHWLLRNYHRATHIGYWRLMHRVVAELVVTTAFLHHNLVIHRDIKLENVLLNADYDVARVLLPRNLPVSTLTDFGLSRRLALPSELLLTKCGSHDYVSPELLMGLNYDGRLLDLWAVGVLTYCILEDRLPFDAPPLEFALAAGVSPSVLKRRQSRNGPAYRIATIDWSWYRALELQKNEAVSSEANSIISSLKALVEVLLVRKDRRASIQSLIDREGFEWITQQVPPSFLTWRNHAPTSNSPSPTQ